MWARVRTAQVSWPSAQLTGWSSGSVTLQVRPGLREQVGGVLGMLWRRKDSEMCCFFVNCSESGVCVCICVLFGYNLCLLDAMLSLFGGLIVKATEPQIPRFRRAPKFNPSAICV